MRPIANDKPEKLEQSVEIGMLCAFYGGLLTQRQLDALRLHYEEDLSLGEIAEQFEVSRQNVHELITRSVQKLRRYEAALGGVKRSADTVRALRSAVQLLDGLQLSQDQQDRLNRARALITQTIDRQEGEENDHGI